MNGFTDRRLLPFSSLFGVIMTFSFIASGSMFARLEKLNREVFSLFHFNASKTKKRQGKKCEL